MPFYEYQCKNCGHELEAMQRVSDAPLKKCPHCGKSQLERLMSAPVFRLKGGGWYETDFKDDKDKKRNLADREEAPKEADKKPAETDAKAEAPAADSAKKETKPEVKPKEPSAPAKTAKPKPSLGKRVAKKARAKAAKRR